MDGEKIIMGGIGCGVVVFTVFAFFAYPIYNVWRTRRLNRRGNERARRPFQNRAY